MSLINTALLSFGMSGKVFHAPFLREDKGYKLVGAWERSTPGIQAAYPGSRRFHSLDEVLQDPQVELVIVNTPTWTHPEYAAKALSAGKHVVVEKAFTTNAAEARALSRLAVSKERKLAIYQNRRWDSDFMTVQKVVSEGVLGEIVEALIAYDRFFITLSPKLHRETPGPGGGNLMDLGPHCVDQAIVLFGMPKAVFADIRSCRQGSLVDDYFDLLLYYPSMRVRLKSSYLVKEQGPGFVVHGKRGSFVKPRGDRQQEQLIAGTNPDDQSFGTEHPSSYGLLHTEAQGVEERQQIISLKGNYQAFYDQMYKAIRSGAEVPVTPESGVTVMRVLDAARESHRQCAVVRMEEF